jgi:hypothetical protein
MQPGSRIAHFEVLGLMGAGGMGEVHRARNDRIGDDQSCATQLRGNAFFAAGAQVADRQPSMPEASGSHGTSAYIEPGRRKL